MTDRAPAHAPSTLRPLAHAHDDWREHMRTAYQRTGHTHDSIAAVLKMARKHFSKLFDRALKRHLHAAHLEALRDNPCTRDAWLLFVQQHCLRGGATVTDARPDALSHGARSALLTRELTDVLRRYSDALANGDVDARERAELVRDLREAADAIARALVAIELERAS